MLTQRDASQTEVEIEEMPATEQLAQLDTEARRLLNMSGEEFGRRWRDGEFRDNPDPHIIQVAMLLPDAW